MRGQTGYGKVGPVDDMDLDYFWIGIGALVSVPFS